MKGKRTQKPGPKVGSGKPVAGRPGADTARGLAASVLMRVEGGAFSNPLLASKLGSSGLSEQDRHFATELVYGVLRMRRACDWAVDRFLANNVGPAVRTVLRMGTYELLFMRTPAHAAVSSAVDLAPGRSKSVVNAVLRKVASAGEPAWPNDAVRLSYPDWIVDTLTADLGADQARGALAAMDEPGGVTPREDGYIQDLASQWVVEALGASAGETVIDCCAAPGGKATGLAAALGSASGLVAASDKSPARVERMVGRARELGATNLSGVVADGRRPPFRPGAADRVLVDAPCSGLGALRRRADARWRVTPGDVNALAEIQKELVSEALALLRPGGVLAYSVCTLTAQETIDIDTWLAQHHPDLVPLIPPGQPWESLGRGAILLPQTAGTDGMYVVLLQRQDNRRPLPTEP